MKKILIEEINVRYDLGETGRESFRAVDTNMVSKFLKKEIT